MTVAMIRSEPTLASGESATLWILECPHGRFTFLTHEGSYPSTEGTIARRELLPKHDVAHDNRCTERLWQYYMGLTTRPGSEAGCAP